ncbi:hypothetical protein CPT_Muenster_454 [Klebsiella phage Muenster]|nr:hypothetical protein CPT_Muenster_454 [Klebsiella phage Muenster]
MPIHGKPDECSNILKNFNFSDFNRTVRQNGIYYYKHKVYNSLRISVNARKGIILFKREIRGQKRTDCVTYSLKDNKVSILYKQGFSSKLFEYDFSTDEDEIFMQSTVQDKFYPKYADFIKIKRLFVSFKQDIIEWSNELEKNALKRRSMSYTYINRYRT